MNSTGNDALISTDLERALTATASDFKYARTPPGRIYYDPEIYRRELADIFGRLWLCVGHRSRLTEAGDFFTVDVGDESVIITLDNDDRERAFLNVCRHRGTRISVEQSGKCRGFLCPYHAWRYGLDGRLLAASAGLHRRTAGRAAG